MKKLPQSIFISLPPVRLFVEDIELIEEIYKINCKSYKIRTEEYEIDCLEELKELGVSELDFLKFDSCTPYIHLEISSKRTIISSHVDDVASTGIASKLKDILKSRRSPLIYSASTWSGVILVTTLILSSILLLHNQITDNVIFNGSVLLTELLLWIIQVFLLKFGTAKFPVVSVKNRNEKTNFLLEHKNQIRLLFIGGLITLIVQLLVQWFKQNIFDTL